jgi:hypothetical protein
MLRYLCLLIAVAVAGCAGSGADSSNGDGQSDAVQVVGEAVMRLESAAPGDGVRTFGDRLTRGQVDAIGAWTLRSEITHRRLRCATYEAGLQVGRGDQGCTRVDWLGTPVFGSPMTQCNGATRIHSRTGNLGLGAQATADANCVRVLTLCTGPC